MNTMKVLSPVVSSLIVLAVGLSSAVAEAAEREVPAPTTMLVGSGVMCDSKNDLETLLTEIHLSGGGFPKNIPATCGRFVPEQPITMSVTPLEWYSTPSVDALIARFVFTPNGWTQFGWVAYAVNPDYVPVSDNSL